MSSTRGSHYTTPPGARALLPWASDLNRAFPEALPSSASSHLALRPREGTGRGLFIRDGYTVAHGTRLAAYSGLLTLQPDDSSRYLLELPEALLNGRVVQPYVDARLQCCRGDPPPAHAALLNHQCENPTTAAQWWWPPGSALPVMVCVSRDSLRGGAELTYNYDAHLRPGSFTVGPEAAAAALLRGAALQPCLCAFPAGCPNRRFLP